MHSIETGLPILREMAEKEGSHAVSQFEREVVRGLQLVPSS
jgi:hypothetical protein